MQACSKRGFLTKVLFSSSDISRFKELDEGLTTLVNDMQKSLLLESIQLQRTSYDDLMAANQAVLARVESMGGPQVQQLVVWIGRGVVCHSSVYCLWAVLPPIVFGGRGG